VIGVGAQIGLRRNDDVFERHCLSPGIGNEVLPRTNDTFARAKIL
jgi:hypothetical protein